MRAADRLLDLGRAVYTIDAAVADTQGVASDLSCSTDAGLKALGARAYAVADQVAKLLVELRAAELAADQEYDHDIAEADRESAGNSAGQPPARDRAIQGAPEATTEEG